MNKWTAALLFLLALLAVRREAPADLNVSSPVAVQDGATGSTGSAVPAKAIYLGFNGSGNLTGLVACDSSTNLQFSSATTTQLVALVSGKKIYVCGWSLSSTTATTSLKFVYGTGSNCVTGTTNLTQPIAMTTSNTFTQGAGIGALFSTIASNALCATVTGSSPTVNVNVTYTQF